jgi:type 1 fimbria pilin
MGTTTVIAAQARNQIDVLNVVDGMVSLAAITTDGTGVAVDFSTDFRNTDGVVDLTGKFLRLLVVNNAANADSVRMQINGITDGTNPRYITIPGGGGREFPGFSTGVAIVLEEGATTAGVVTLEAWTDGSYVP